MRDVKREIEKETFDRYSEMNYRTRTALLKEDMPDQWLYGYGFYGHRLHEDNGKYYVIYTIGEHCD